MNRLPNNFAIFILSYGRHDSLDTLNTLSKTNYKGKIYIVCSSDDKTLSQYKKKYRNVLVFDKNDYEGKFDIGDNFNHKKVVVYARNAVFDLAEQNGVEEFLVLDDDYIHFRYTTDGNGNYITSNVNIKDFNRLLCLMLNYYRKINAKTLCIAQGGDFIGGEGSSVFKKKLSRKAMNFFICSTKRRFNFIGRINEDVNTYVRYGTLGDLFLTICDLRLQQKDTQQNEGGLTDFYLDTGTYVKSFYTVIFNPSCAKVTTMGVTNRRLHHKINWNNTTPKIISKQYGKT